MLRHSSCVIQAYQSYFYICYTSECARGSLTKKKLLLPVVLIDVVKKSKGVLSFNLSMNIEQSFKYIKTITSKKNMSSLQSSFSYRSSFLTEYFRKYLHIVPALRIYPFDTLSLGTCCIHHLKQI